MAKGTVVAKAVPLCYDKTSFLKKHKEGQTMITHKEEREFQKVEHASGGAGYILKEALIKGEQLGDSCSMFSEVTIKPGCELGYHEHHGETETYYLLKGKGIYNENGTKREISAGDVTFCPDGEGHGLVNDGEEDIVFIALILKKK